MKYYLISGEASGDLHGSNLMKALKGFDPEADFRFFGGDLMQKQGGVLVKHYRQMAFMGFVKVALNLRTILKNIKMCKSDILVFKPDTIIFIDFAGFNLQIAKFAKQKGFKTVFYISPKIWAWKQNRVKKIKKHIDKMLTILPFETEFYQKFNYPVEYVGNPVLDAIDQFHQLGQSENEFRKQNQFDERPIVALLAGSRRQEIKLMLPLMLEISRYFPQNQFAIAGAPGIEPEFYHQFIGGFKIPVLFDQTYQLIKSSRAALVTSGTATLETALIGTPQVVCYNTNIGDLLFRIGRKLIHVRWLSLVNLILNREAVKELVQYTFKKEFLIAELDALLNQADYRQKMLDNYAELRQIMGNPGASERAAKSIYAFVKS